MQIYVSGSLAYDRIMNFPGKFSDHILSDKLHNLNVCFLVDGLFEKFGGTAGNIAYNLSLLGESPLLLAASGKDFQQYEQWLRRHNLSLEGVRKVPGEFTAGAYITTDLSGNQITAFNPGAMKYTSEYPLEKAHSGEALAIVSPGNLEDMAGLSRRFKALNIPVIFDPGQATPALSGAVMTEMITGAHMLISNDYELELIKNATGLSLPEMLGLTETIITTSGEAGSLIQTRREKIEVPPARADRVVDPTGAGDAYRAGLIKGLVMKKTLTEAARMGAVCASYAVAHRGTQEHTYDMEVLRARYRENFG